MAIQHFNFDALVYFYLLQYLKLLLITYIHEGRRYYALIPHF